MIAHFNKNSSSCKCESNSMIQGISGRIESRRSKTSRSRGSWEVKSEKILDKRKVREVVKYLV